MKDLFTVASEFIDSRLITESKEDNDGGNEFNHLEQAIFASKELENSLRALSELNPGKYDKYRDVIKKIKEINSEFPPMLDSLKRGMDGEVEGEEEDEEGDWWTSNEDEEEPSEEEEDFKSDDFDQDSEFEDEFKGDEA